ncbi:MAG: hypothetical protein ACXVCP_05635 [Bdellovibrio sp.]
MQKWIFLSAVLIFSTNAFAQRIKVQKVKGNQAVIEFSGGVLRPDHVYELSPEQFTANNNESESRKYIIAVGLNFHNTKSDAVNSVSQTDIILSAKFGWNLGHFELGPLVSYSSTDNGNLTNSLLKGGAFVDFNAIENLPGEVFLYGLGGTGSYGQYDGGSVKRDVIDFFVGPFVKWFPTGSPVAFRIDGGYVYQKQSGGIGGDLTITGFASNIELLAYF